MRGKSEGEEGSCDLDVASFESVLSVMEEAMLSNLRRSLWGEVGELVEPVYLKIWGQTTFVYTFS